MSEIKVGIIGCGWIVEKAHIPSYQRISEVNLYAIYDIDLEAARNISKKSGIKHVFDNLDEFLSSGIGAVIIASPNFTHSEYTKKALKNGIHVLCEKPVALSQKDIVEIVKLAEEKAVIYMPGFVNRFRKDIQKIYQMVQDECIGEIKGVETAWLRKAGIPKVGTWFTNKKLSGGGVLVDLGSHMIDLCTLFLKGGSIKNIRLNTVRDYEEMIKKSASWFQGKRAENIISIDVEETAFGIVLYEDGKEIKLDLSWSAEVENDYTRLFLKGEKGTIELRTLFGFSNQRLWKDDEVIVKINNDIVEHIYFDREENNSSCAFLEMSKYFIDQIKTKNKAYLVAKDAIESVSLIEQLYNNETVSKQLEDVSFVGNKNE